MVTRFIISFAVIFLIISGVYGQGTVRGVIYGTDDENPLIFATVVVQGTTTGTVSDYNGEYLFRLAPGTYTLEISYVGYGLVEKTITLEDNQVIELNVGLTPTTIMGKEVVITAQARGQLAAVNQQLRSNQIINVVSAERIRELPDENAAQAISRLPGVHLDGDKIVIRGVQPKMNKILINGVEMPSTSSTDRSVGLGMISSNMLSGIEVFKTLTPNMDADAIGGTVNLRLRDAPEGFNYNFMSQGEYNHQLDLMGHYRFWGDISNRFFNNKLGVALNLNYQASNSGTPSINYNFTRLTEAEIGEAEYFRTGFTLFDKMYKSKEFGGSIVMDYLLPTNGKLIFTSMFSHSNPETIEHYNSIGYLTALRFNTGLEHNEYTQTLLNNSLRYEQQIGIVRLDASASYVSIDRTDKFRYRYSFGRGVYDSFYREELPTQRLLTMEPWEIMDYYVPNIWENYRMGSFHWFPSNMNESRFVSDLGLSIPFTIFDNLSINVRAGGKLKHMQRENFETARRYGDDISGGPIHRPMADYLASIGQTDPNALLYFKYLRDNDYKVSKRWLNNTEHYDMLHVIDSDITRTIAVDLMDHDLLFITPSEHTNDYWGRETVYAAYLMGEINIGPKLFILPGLRYERIDNDYNALKIAHMSKLSFNIADTLSRPASHEHWLPHLHMRYNLTNWWDVRFSYNRTLSRPDYTHAIPSVYYDVIATSGTAGNPYIAPAVSENLDLNFTFYTPKLGLITIGGYNKTIEDVFYSHPFFISNLPDSSIVAEFPLETFPAFEMGETNFFINNPNPAYVKGLEAEWQSNLSHLPSPFNGLVLNINYMRAWSETKYMQYRVDKVSIPTFPFVMDVQNDTIFTNRLLHQASDIGNISVGYDYKGFSARFSFRYQGDVISGVARRTEENTYTTDIYRYDFVMTQRIPLQALNLQLVFNAVNFTNAPSGNYRVFPNRGATTISESYSGRRFQLGIRLTRRRY